jgi:hypothetical protein
MKRTSVVSVLMYSSEVNVLLRGMKHRSGDFL